MNRREFLKKASAGGASAGIMCLAGCSSVQRPKNIGITVNTRYIDSESFIDIRITLPEEDDVRVRSGLSGSFDIIYSAESPTPEFRRVERLPNPPLGVSVVLEKLENNTNSVRLAVSAGSENTVKRTSTPGGVVEIQKSF